MKFEMNKMWVKTVFLALMLGIMNVKAQKNAAVIHKNCKLVNAGFNDGDSFEVQLPNGKKQVFRLYGVDCVETNANDEDMKMRLDAQAYYFGVFKIDKENARHERMIKWGKLATKKMNDVLRGNKPFTVITYNVNAGGKFKNRLYAFVTTSNREDLGKLMVKEGIARVHGKDEDLPDRDEGSYGKELLDLEMAAISGSKGIWRKTGWRDFAKEKTEYRKFVEKININTIQQNQQNIKIIAKRSKVPVKLVTALFADRDKKGNFNNKKDLDSADGIAHATAAKLASVLKFK